MSPRRRETRPLAAGAAVFLGGTALGIVMWTAGLTSALAGERSASDGPLVLMWLAALVVISTWISAALISRPTVVARLQRSDRASARLASLDPDEQAKTASAIEQIKSSVDEIAQTFDDAPSLSDLSRQIGRTRSQIESRLQLQQRTIDHLIEETTVRAERGAAQDVAQFSIIGAQPKNVFVLGTGRCGTATFNAACTHFDNFTSGHETRVGELSAARFDYPSRHIESDNRLSWFLGELAQRFDDDETAYVHLTRSPEDVISSYTRRWHAGYRSTIGRAFGNGIVIRSTEWPDDEIDSVIRFYVETVTANVESFLTGRRSMAMELEHLTEQFPAFIEWIGAAGDLEAANAELLLRHNASPPQPAAEVSNGNSPSANV